MLLYIYIYIATIKHELIATSIEETQTYNYHNVELLICIHIYKVHYKTCTKII